MLPYQDQIGSNPIFQLLSTPLAVYWTPTHTPTFCQLDPVWGEHGSKTTHVNPVLCTEVAMYIDILAIRFMHVIMVS